MNIQLPPPPRDQPKFNVNLPILSFSLEELNHVCMTLNPTWVVFVFTLIYIILIEIKFLFYINLIVILRIEIVKESNFPISSSSRRLQPILYMLPSTHLPSPSPLLPLYPITTPYPDIPPPDTHSAEWTETTHPPALLPWRGWWPHPLRHHF